MKRMKNERSFKDRRKRGVSPVIGVILMVAATIVIAAVVLAMLGGFTAPSRTYIVAVTAEERNPAGILTLYVTYQGGPDHSEVDSLTGEIDGVTLDTIDPLRWGTTDGSNADISIGSVASDATTVSILSNHVIVTATFIDGTTQVILDTWT